MELEQNYSNNIYQDLKILNIRNREQHEFTIYFNIVGDMSSDANDHRKTEKI